MVVQHSSASVEHFTPADVVERSRRVLGTIDLDPASCEEANKTIGARHYLTAAYGLQTLADQWDGSVFLNPPGGTVPKEWGDLGTKSLSALFWGKLAEEWEAGRVTHAIFVGFTLEILRSTQALDVPWPGSFPFCVPKQRLKFVKPGGEVGKQPSHANVIVYLPTVKCGNNRLAFYNAFETLGECVNI